MIPFSRMDAASSSSFSGENVLRGWPRWGRISSMGQEKKFPRSVSVTGRSAAIPLPRPVFLTICPPVPLHQLTCQFQITCGPARGDVIENYRLAMARRFGEAHVSRYDGFKCLPGE